MKGNTTPFARWATYKQAARYSGLSTRLLQDFVKDGLISSSLVRKPGAGRGVRLIDLHSLDEFIEQGLHFKAELAMNRRPRGKREPQRPAEKNADSPSEGDPTEVEPNGTRGSEHTSNSPPAGAT